MLHQERLLKTVLDRLAILLNSLEQRGLISLFDQNILAEQFFANFLNIMYGYNLINLNVHRQDNYPGIDLGDSERQIAFQVSICHESRKIQKSIDKFIEHEQSKEYNHLKVLVLGKKQKEYKKLNTQGKINFNPNTDIIDVKKDIVKDLKKLDTAKLEELAAFISREITLDTYPRKRLIIANIIMEIKKIFFRNYKLFIAFFAGLVLYGLISLFFSMIIPQQQTLERNISDNRQLGFDQLLGCGVTNDPDPPTNIRSRPSENGFRLDGIDNGTFVEIYERGIDEKHREWIRVVYKEDRRWGWVARRLVQTKSCLKKAT